MVECQNEGATTTLILTPNRSASWQQSKLFVGFMALVVFTIAIGWSLVGAWMILPFAGLEIGLLGVLTYFVSRKTYQRQIVRVSPSKIYIETGIKFPHIHVELKRQDSYLEVISAQTDFEKPQLFLFDNHKRVEIGHFLNRKDANQVKEYLTRAGLMICSNKWWKLK